MDKPKKRNDASAERETPENARDDRDSAEDIEKELDEIDDTAILNELLADLSPELVDEDDEEAEATSEPEVETPPPSSTSEPPSSTTKSAESADKAAVEEEGSWLFDGTLGDEMESAKPVEEASEQLEETPTESAAESKDSGSWLFDESFTGEEVGEEEAAVASSESAETAPSDAEDAEGGIFSSDSIDQAFAAFGMTEDEKPGDTAESSEEKEAGPLLDESELGEALSGIDMAEETAENDSIGSESDVAAAAIGAASVDGDTTEISQASEQTADITKQLVRLAALHYVNRLSVALGAPVPAESREATVEPAPVGDATEEEPALTADIEDDFVVVESEEEVVVSEPDIPDVGELLSLELEAEEGSETEPEVVEESLDDLIASAVLATEETEEKAMPEEEAVPTEGEEEKAEEGVETEAQVPVAAPSQPTDDHDELEQLISEMKARQKRRRIIGVALVVVVLGILGYGLFGPASDKTADTAPVDFMAEEPAEIPMEPVETAAAAEPPPAPVTPPPAPTPVPPPVTPPPAPTRPAAVTPPPRVPAAASVTSTPSGRYTVHASSYRSMESAERGRTIWRQRGYDYVMVWSWINPANGEQWYRLGVGRYATRDDANRAKETIVSRNFLNTDDWAPVTRIPEGAR